MLSVHLCIPPVNFLMAGQIITKNGTYIMAPELISTPYFRNPLRQSVCLYVYPINVARQQLSETLPLQLIQTQQ
jgi:hypothetical protein